MSQQDELMARFRDHPILKAIERVMPQVNRTIIQRAQLAKTPVVVADQDGNILHLNPDDLARELLSDSPK
jgi:hypothetical protein